MKERKKRLATCIEDTQRLASKRSKGSRFVEFGELKKTGSFFPCDDLTGCSLPLKLIPTLRSLL